MGMQMKKYQAATLQKAIEQIRAELGDGAIILQVDPISSGMFGRNGVEVTAAIDRKEMPHRFRATVGDDDVDERRMVQSNDVNDSTKWTSMFKNPFKKGSLPSPNQKAKTSQAVQEQVKRLAAQSVIKPTLPSPRAAERDELSSAANTSMGQLYAVKTALEPLKKEISEIRETLNKNHASNSRQASSAFIESEIHSLRQTLQSYIQEKRYEGQDINTDVQRLASFWRDKGMSEKQIYNFFNQLECAGVDITETKAASLIRPVLEKTIHASRSLEASKKKIVILVGPTGVGKTTTIAKLAAFEKLKLNRKVALVTIDDYKIGATDQLNHYARILDVPFLKTRNDMPLEEQLRTFDVDTIFIDTFGVSPKDEEKLLQLRRAIHFRDAHLAEQREIHLSLPVGLAQGDVENNLAGFETLQPQFLLFTKWDETDNWGGMLAAILASDRPVSYVGNGQEVPDDLTIFSRENFIKIVTNIG
ncbi:MAG: flagellar biosynthesis protein FlhF [Deltaproteobacteria bacterium CG11_big_fil_rev_8_21_14_0_20_45_16]|nr:MAG: flagellar biosynthesis protein FlhF [Deltaproteobacteria bacterium CG11_big_fil_rev_8_21_14_0_20_45_16]